VKHTTQTNCPLCNGSSSRVVLRTRDLMMSNEEFPICACDTCGFWYTNPRPIESQIGDYYKHADYISHTSSKRGLIDRVYHVVRNIALRDKLKLVQRYSTNGLVVDYGCGTGHFVKKLIQADLPARGYEPDSDARNFSLSELQLETHPLKDFVELVNGEVDIITMWHVLEHVYNLREDVAVQISKLRAGGHWVVAVPNRLSKDATVYGPLWAAYDVPRHLYHFTVNDMKSLGEQFGLELLEVVPMKFDAYYVSILSERYRGGNIARALWNGLLSNFSAKPTAYSSLIYVFRKREAV